MLQASWKWSVLIAASVVGVALVTFVDTAPPALRTLVASWFLLVCPGLALVRLMRLNEPLRIWPLAIALSLALDAVVAITMLYANVWSVQLGMVVLMGICLFGLSFSLIQQRA